MEHFLLAGAVAGLSYTLVSYPIDIVKTNLQLNKSFKESCRAALNISKLAGYKIVLTRSIIIDSCSFLFMKNVSSSLSKLAAPNIMRIDIVNIYFIGLQTN